MTKNFKTVREFYDKELTSERGNPNQKAWYSFFLHMFQGQPSNIRYSARMALEKADRQAREEAVKNE